MQQKIIKKYYPFLFSIPFIGALITMLLYIPTLYYGFLFDDVPNIMKFYDIRHATFSDLFFARTRWLSGWINTFHYSYGKFDPFSYRLSNIIMHSISGILIFFIFMLALDTVNKNSFFYKNRFSLSALTSLLFLLHPVQTQTVSYVIQGQLEGLAGFFILIMSLLFLLLPKTQSLLSSFLLCILICGFALFSVGTKEIAIVGPLLLLLIDWFFVAHGSLSTLKKRFFLHATLMLIVWGGYVYLLKPDFFKQLFGLSMQARNNLGNQLTHNRFDTITPLHYFISQFKVILHYIWIFIWPFNMSIDYDEKMVTHFFALDCILPFIALLTLLIGCFYLLHKNKTNPLVFGIFWFFIVILPRSSIIPASELIADYKTYIASIGLLFVFASALIKLVTSSIQKQSFQFLIYSLFISGLAWATTQRNHVWQSGEALWANVIQNAPHRARAYNNYAAALFRRKAHKEAIPYLQKALQIDEHYPDAWSNLSLAYSTFDDMEKALHAINKALTMRPSPENYLNLSTIYIKLNKHKDARDACKAAIKKYREMKKNEYGKAWYNLGACYQHLNKQEKAWEAFQIACKKADMDNEQGFTSFGRQSMKLKKYSDAVWAFNKAWDENPQSFDHAYNLGYAAMMNEQFDDALHIFNNLAQLNPQDKRIQHNIKWVKRKNYERN